MNKVKIIGRRFFVIFCIIMASVCALSSCTIFRDVSDDTPATAPAGATADATDTVSIPQSSVNTETQSSEAVPADPYEGISVTFAAAGDNLIHPNIYMEAESRAEYGEGYNFKPMYSEIADIIASADLAFINQETLMAGDGFEVSGYPSFNSPQKLGLDLVELGFDIINIANNHMLDKSAAGLDATIDFWNTQPVTLLGGYKNAADSAKIRTIEIDGITIAFLSYAHHTNGITLPSSSELDIPYVEDARIEKELAEAEKIADFTIVSVHWGEENTAVQDDEQTRLAHLMAENGADVILGHHSHTLLPLEWIERDDGTKTLCAYSLGNLVSAMMYPENMVGGLLSFTVKSDGAGGLCVDDISFTPTVFYYGMNHFGTHIYRLENYTADIAGGHGTQMYGYTTTYEKAVTYLKRAIPAEYLPDYIK